ncbi:FecR family protein [Sphingomonas laterariae]|uniref:FecR family protein n=2 Tax=Edaphosphingomonas laterariae TaxID=861865 RepID=A0A239E2P4_9SPHN|nr:FecR family protein [Sphingomonas laterariae]
MIPYRLIALIATLALSSPALAEIGRVKRVVGQAWVERSGQKLAPAPGFALSKGDTLATGRDGRLSITFIDNTRFSAGPNSRIALSEFRFDETSHKGQFVTKVDRGSLAVVSGQIAKEDPKAMQVRTPTSLLGVRGTRFVVNVP